MKIVVLWHLHSERGVKNVVTEAFGETKDLPTYIEDKQEEFGDSTISKIIAHQIILTEY